MNIIIRLLYLRSCSAHNLCYSLLFCLISLIMDSYTCCNASGERSQDKEDTARARSAKSTPCTRSPNSRKERIALLLRERGVTIVSNQVMEVKRVPQEGKHRVPAPFAFWNMKRIIESRRPSISYFHRLILGIFILNVYISKQAKTTKKIVLRLQCQGCKHVS